MYKKLAVLLTGVAMVNLAGCQDAIDALCGYSAEICAAVQQYAPDIADEVCMALDMLCQ